MGCPGFRCAWSGLPVAVEFAGISRYIVVASDLRWCRRDRFPPHHAKPRDDRRQAVHSGLTRHRRHDRRADRRRTDDRRASGRLSVSRTRGYFWSLALRRLTHPTGCALVRDAARNSCSDAGCKPRRCRSRGAWRTAHGCRRHIWNSGSGCDRTIAIGEARPQLYAWRRAAARRNGRPARYSSDRPYRSRLPWDRRAPAAWKHSRLSRLGAVSMHLIKEIVRIERPGFAAPLAFQQSGAQPLDLQFVFFSHGRNPQLGTDARSYAAVGLRSVFRRLSR